MIPPDSYASSLYAETKPSVVSPLQKVSSERKLRDTALVALCADTVTCVAVLYACVLGWSYRSGVHDSFLQSVLYVSSVGVIFATVVYRTTRGGCTFDRLDETAQIVRLCMLGILLTAVLALVAQRFPWQAFATGFIVIPVAVTLQSHARRSILSKWKRKESESGGPSFGMSEICHEHARQLGGCSRNRVSLARRSMWYRFSKRMIDVCVSSILLVLLSPVLLLIAALVRLTSDGPALFAHERVGLEGRLFRIYKFRSMACDSFSYEISPVESSDPRITRVGRFLRRTGLDELPQLINILLGQMSLVGPRPEMPFIVDRYNELQWRRLQVLPGLTGVWQLSADRAYPIHENLHHDLFYIERRNLSLDVAILVHTLVFAMRGGI